jgi:predicted nuclease of restriction endonuclease-like (RecB) superfamily
MENKSDVIGKDYLRFLSEIKDKIHASQYAALSAVNKQLIELYLYIGKKLVEKNEWGEAIVEKISKDLQQTYPAIKGFSARNLWNMKNFYLFYSTNPKLQPLVAEISWVKNLIVLERCRDPLEMGDGFCFVGNQYRIEIEVEEYFIDLVLYHRKLKSLIAVELKVGKFKPEYAGKMQFYLSVLNDKVRVNGENPAIGIIICKEKNRTVVEYALKDVKKPISIATYKITSSLPEELAKYLPSREKITERLDLLG